MNGFAPRVASFLLSLTLPMTAAAQSLDQRLQALQPGQWLSYEVPLQSGLRPPCCFTWHRQQVSDEACRLDGKDWNFGHRDSDPVPPEGSALRVLLRRGDGGFDRVRAVGSQCAVDRADATVVEAGRIDGERSVKLLSASLATQPKRERGHVVAAIAHHAVASADVVLQAAAASGRDEDLRRDAVFWLAQARGESGFRVVRELLERESDDDLRRHEVFAISLSPVDAAKTELRRLARHHGDEDVRGEAIFWLAQNDDAQVEAIIREALASDDSQEVRKKAVFALSQLPPQRAVPALRELVERGASRAIRKEALFWLAQVDDDAVLPVFDALLASPDQ